MITIQEFKAKYNLMSRANIVCIHRVRQENRRARHKRIPARRGGCRPPFYDHVFGFRDRETRQPMLVCMPYYQNEKELNEIKKQSTAYAEKNNCNVRFSTEETWCHPQTVLVAYTRKYFIKVRLWPRGSARPQPRGEEK